MDEPKDSSDNTVSRPTSGSLLKARESMLQDSDLLTQAEIDSLRKEARDFHRNYKGYFSDLK